MGVNLRKRASITKAKGHSVEPQIPNTWDHQSLDKAYFVYTNKPNLIDDTRFVMHITTTFTQISEILFF